MTSKAQIVLETPMEENDANASTIREYLQELLRSLFREGESFSGKRPFGNSGWESEINVALVKSGLVDGEIDEWGGLVQCDLDKAYELIDEAISEL